MSKYLFLLAYAHGCDCSLPTNVHDQKDLLQQFKLGNEYVFALGIELPDNLQWSNSIAAACGYSEAFHAGYTAENTLSYCFTLEEAGYSEFPAGLASFGFKD